MNVFSKTYDIGIGEVDKNLCYRPYCVLHNMQDAATIHSEILGFSRDQMIEKCGGVFILTKLFYKLFRPVKYREELTVNTWHRGLKGLLWNRDFEFFASGEHVGIASTAWVILNPKTKRILRPREFAHLEFPSFGKSVEDFEMPKTAIDMPDDGAKEFVVRYSQIDVNSHVNNTRYIEMCQDALGAQAFENRYVKCAAVSYQKELCCDEKYNVFIKKQGGEIYFLAKAEQENKFEAMMELADI